MMQPPPRILLVEDNPADVDLMHIALEELAVTADITVAADGRGAVAALPVDAPAAPFDLILVDLNLPGVDGFAVLDHLAGARWQAAAAIVVLSSSRNPHDTHRALALGARAFVNKAATIDEWLRTVADLVSIAHSAAGR